MKRFLRSLAFAALVAAAGCCSVKVAPERVGVCSWSWRQPMKQVAVEMAKADVKGIHLALGPFIAPDNRHGAAEGADVIVAVLGTSEKITGECRSRTSLDLPGRQETLLRRLHATGKPVVLVLVNGQPVTVNWADRNVAAILETWFGGSRVGVAVARTLFGEVNPSGRLNVTFPKSVGQIELNFPFKKGSHNDQTDEFAHTRVQGPLYPFGFGLSYTTFAYANLSISPKKAGPRERRTVSCDVTNTGTRPGAEVVQLYVRDLESSVVTWDSILRGFEKVFLEPGETRRVTFILEPQHLELLDRDMKWTVEPGDFEIRIGASSADIRLRDLLTVE